MFGQPVCRQCVRRAGRELMQLPSLRLAGKARGMFVMARRTGVKSAQKRAVPTVTKLEWQKPLQIRLYPDPCLRAQNARIGVFDESLLQLAKEMFEIMYQDNGVGLAAPQVGVNVRLMVCNETGERGRGQEMILVNPEIVAASKATTTGEEGCLSFPGIYANVSRAVEIEVRAQNERAEVVQFKMSGWPAIIFQHEYDHLQGVLYHDRMAPSVLETVRPRLVELENSFLQSNPGVKVQRLAPPKVSKGFGS